MTNYGRYHGGSSGAARSRRGPAKRIGWSAAGRLVDGKLGGSGTEDLGALIAVASAPAPAAETDPVLLEPVLMAFRRAGAGPEPQRRPQRAARPRSSRAALAKCAAVFLIIGGSGVAAASAGVLPTSVQRIAHDYFGGVGVPAPSAAGRAGSSPSSGTLSPSGSASPRAGSNETAGSTEQLAPLCREVAAAYPNWRAGLDAADQAALLAAAGGPNHVEEYCAALLAVPGSGAAGGASEGATSSPGQPAEPTSKPSPSASATHGNGHASHSPTPNPHSTGR